MKVTRKVPLVYNNLFLGEGHYAVVKLARHVFTGEKVAVKVQQRQDYIKVSGLYKKVSGLYKKVSGLYKKCQDYKKKCQEFVNGGLIFFLFRGGGLSTFWGL